MEHVNGCRKKYLMFELDDRTNGPVKKPEVVNGTSEVIQDTSEIKKVTFGVTKDTSEVTQTMPEVTKDMIAGLEVKVLQINTLIRPTTAPDALQRLVDYFTN